VDTDKFKEIFNQYYEAVRSFAYYKTGDIYLAEDIVQDTFLKLWDKRHTIKSELTLKPLIYTIATNIIKNHYKHKKAVYNFIRKTQAQVESEAADFNIEQQEFNKLLNHVLSEVPEKARIVFLMNRIGKLTYTEIAESLNLSVKAIEKRMSVALGIIKKRIIYRI
jgi:RNA polymerase sigma-70 factor (ECF subfamily)